MYSGISFCGSEGFELLLESLILYKCTITQVCEWNLKRGNMEVLMFYQVVYSTQIVMDVGM